MYWPPAVLDNGPDIFLTVILISLTLLTLFLLFTDLPTMYSEHPYSYWFYNKTGAILLLLYYIDILTTIYLSTIHKHGITRPKWRWSPIDKHHPKSGALHQPVECAPLEWRRVVEILLQGVVTPSMLASDEDLKLSSRNASGNWPFVIVH